MWACEAGASVCACASPRHGSLEENLNFFFNYRYLVMFQNLLSWMETRTMAKVTRGGLTKK